MAFKEYKGLDLAATADEVLKQWDKEQTFRRSIDERQGAPSFVFYEGPPSANGVPGIHHVMARTIKDVFCRYKTQQGFRVHRKAGWDTHGLPVELGVEKKLGITKEDIGKKISIADYNLACRQAVMEYTDQWEDLTRRMGYWVDMKDPYITYDNKYIETLWWLLRQLFDKGLLYKGYTIQPYSPAAGTGLSTHELNQPGCYRDVKDTTAAAQFRVIRTPESEKLFEGATGEVYFLAWTTTPWTLPSNTALAVGPQVEYVRVRSLNPYTQKEQTAIVARELIDAWFKKIEHEVLPGTWRGCELTGIRYEQLIPWVRPDDDAFRVIEGDFVTTSDGTGIVHIAPTFGADDNRAAQAAGIPALLLRDRNGKDQPMVDRRGRFFPLEELDPRFVAEQMDATAYQPWAGRYVKNEYAPEAPTETLDVDLSVALKSENKIFRIEKHTHSYPHCWRTDKPVLYYPLDSWFIRTTALRERMIALNETIHWMPEATGTGRFGKWLEGLVDWNLSRSRFWGTPLPIWATEDYSEMKCIGSVEELKTECEKAVAAGLMAKNPLEKFTGTDYSIEILDLHRPFVDQITLVSPTGKPMRREADLIDVWFDSGAMPYAQVHYPFEHKNDFSELFPADFIAEGVDQTRGWFFTLHALSTMLFDSVAFRNIISNGLVLDKNGNKMSKRLGNSVDPFQTLRHYGADAVRWYMITNSQPWDNLRFDPEGVDEVRRKFFGTLYNTYSFFALYANVDSFTGHEAEVPVAERPEIDRWILSLLNSLTADVTAHLEGYDPTPAARAIASFVDEHLSNWYVRLNRKRFWGRGLSADKLAAYQTLRTCLDTVARLSAPFAPFIADRIYRDLGGADSVHLASFPVASPALVDKQLEKRMEIAQRATSLVLSLRRKASLKVRQPLARVMVPLTPASENLRAVEELFLNEVNIRAVEYVSNPEAITKRIRPNFKTVGKRYPQQMKAIAAAVGAFSQADIAAVEAAGVWRFEGAELFLEDFEITPEDMPGWLVASDGGLTVALDITLTDELRQEGVARELVNRIQNLRKESGLEVTDQIDLQIADSESVRPAVLKHREYIAAQTLACSLSLVDRPAGSFLADAELDEGSILIAITRK